MLKSSTYDEQELLFLVAKGDESAFRILFNHHRKRILFIASGLLNSNEAAEDVLQEVFTRIWLSKENLTEINNLSSYLRVIVRNEAYSLLRKKARMDAFLENNKNLTVAEMHIDNGDQFQEKQRKLEDAMKHLTPQQRKVFELCGLEGQKQGDAARMLGISKSTIKKHMADSYKNIREFLRERAHSFFMLLLLLFLF